jgi:hypothetical protein
MARKDGVAQYKSHHVEEVTTSGVIVGPFAAAGADRAAVFANFSTSSGAGVGNVTLQKAGDSPREDEDRIHWITVGSLSASGELQTGLTMASLYRVVVNVSSNAIKVNYLAGARSI